MRGRPFRPLLRRWSDRLQQGLVALQKADIAQFVALYERPGRLFYLNFLSGIARGFGIGVGFTVVTAAFLLLLARLAALQLPIIGRYIADIARIVHMEMQLRP